MQAGLLLWRADKCVTVLDLEQRSKLGGRAEADWRGPIVRWRLGWELAVSDKLRIRDGVPDWGHAQRGERADGSRTETAGGRSTERPLGLDDRPHTQLAFCHASHPRIPVTLTPTSPGSAVVPRSRRSGHGAPPSNRSPAIFCAPDTVRPDAAHRRTPNPTVMCAPTARSSAEPSHDPPSDAQTRRPAHIILIPFRSPLREQSDRPPAHSRVRRADGQLRPAQSEPVPTLLALSPPLPTRHNLYQTSRARLVTSPSPGRASRPIPAAIHRHPDLD